MHFNSFAALLAVVFLLIGGGLVWMSRRNKKLAAASKYWPSASGTITSSRVAIYQSNDSGDNRPSYQAEIAYEFVVAGQSLQGSRVQFGGRVSTTQRAAQEVVNRYPVGTPVKVFYDPTKPGQCTLEQSAHGTGLLMFLGIVFLIVGSIAAAITILVRPDS